MRSTFYFALGVLMFYCSYKVWQFSGSFPNVTFVGAFGMFSLFFLLVGVACFIAPFYEKLIGKPAEVEKES